MNNSINANRQDNFVQRTALRVSRAKLEYQRSYKEYRMHMKDMKDLKELENDETFLQIRSNMQLTKANYDEAIKMHSSVSSCPPNS
jgi:hypothetical protein